MNTITELLDLEDSNLKVTGIVIDGTRKILTLETPVVAHYCPACGFRMHSRGIRTRQINHPVLQDGYQLVFHLKQRRWRCTNPDCRYEMNDMFRFVNKWRRNTNASDLLILLSFQDLSLSAAAIARKFHTSDTHVLDVFDKYVKLDRLPLTDIISVDEVHLDMDDRGKYALVIQDFHTGDPIDLLRNRRTEVTEPYFTSIPRSERNQVKYLLSDMYNPYISYVDKYFPYAVPVVDSFHVIQWVLRAIDNYIRGLIRQYRQRDREAAEKRNDDPFREVQVPLSNEVYLLQKYRWLVLSNRSNITYHTDPRMDKHFRSLMNTYDYEAALFRISPRLKTLRDLKERYITFNSRNAGNPASAEKEMDDLIHDYYHSGDSIFVDFAELLVKYQQPIINSFVMVEKEGPGKLYSSRLSNGPIEALNRKVKDLKRLGRGFRNFEHFRSRFLYATRNNPVLNGVSDSAQVLYFENDEDDQEVF